jgi:hypothetical protein
MYRYISIFILCISNTCLGQIPNYLSYDNVIKQSREWESKYPDLVQVYNYGGSSKEYIVVKISGTDENKKKILIISALHSNEPLASSMANAYTSYLLYNYHKNDEIKSIVNSRDLYIIPIVCPEYFPNQRNFHGSDPNRNFDEDNSVAPIQALKQLTLKIKPVAAISLHTFGREYLIPYGNSRQRCADEDKYQEIIGHMAKLSNYKLIHACEMYGHPIYGSELDYFYKHHIFAIVQECGTHQHIPSFPDIEYEFTRTWPAFLYFIKTAPEVKID